VQVVPQFDLPLLIEGGEHPVNWAVVGLEHIQEVLWRAVAKIEVAGLGLDLDCGAAEHFGETRTRSP